MPGRGRPPLWISSRGKIARIYLGGGVWLARCRYRDSDGVTRIVERRGPADEHDQHGKLAEDALIEALAGRRPPSGAPDAIGLDTRVMTLADTYISRLAEDGRAASTIYTYTYTAGKFGKLFGGVRVGEATPARIDAAPRWPSKPRPTCAARCSSRCWPTSSAPIPFATCPGSNRAARRVPPR